LHRGHTQQHMDMIRHGITLFHCYAFLTTQIPKYLAYPAPNLAIYNFFVVLRHNMVLAFPLCMCLTLPIFHYGPSCPKGPSSLENRLSNIRLKRQGLLNSHRQSRWINNDLAPKLYGVRSEFKMIRNVIFKESLTNASTLPAIKYNEL